MHTAAFSKAADVIGTARLPGRFPALLKGLWLSNSVTVFGFALILACLAAQPKLMAKPLILVLASTLLGLAVLTYAQVGNFLPAHALLVAGLATIGGCVFRSPSVRSHLARAKKEEAIERI